MTTPKVSTPAPPPDGIYARQDSLKLIIPKRIAIIGCGGIGSWLAYFLALAGATELWLWDSDTVSEHNLNRLPLTREAIGKSKSDALSYLITTARPECTVYAMSHFDEKQADMTELRKTGLWICATTDSLLSRQMVAKWAADNKAYYLEAAAEGEIGSITGEPAGWATEEEIKPGYASVPVWVGPCVMAASLACAHILHSKPLGDESIRVGFTDKGIVYYNSATEHTSVVHNVEPTRHATLGQLQYSTTGLTYYAKCLCDMCTDIRTEKALTFKDLNNYNTYGKLIKEH